MKLWQGLAVLTTGALISFVLYSQMMNYIDVRYEAEHKTSQIKKQIKANNTLVMNKKAKESIKDVDLNALDDRVASFATTALNYPVTGKDDNVSAFKHELSQYATSVAIASITNFRQPTVSLDNQTLPTYKLDNVNRQTVEKNSVKYLVVFAPDNNANQHMIFDLTVDPVSSTVTSVSIYREANTNA